MDDSSVSDPEGKTAAASKSHVSSPLPILSSLVPSATSSPWSSFHSSLTLVARGPGTPVRRTPHSHSEALFSPKSSPSRSSAPSAVVEFQNHFTELDLLLEYKLLKLNCPSGVYVLPSSKSLYEWHGVLFAHSGPYRDGVFRFTMYIPDGFPKTRPMLRFQTRVFHPYVHASNGVLNMLRAFPSWDASKHHLWHVIRYMKQCFFNRDTWSECNEQIFVPQAHACAIESLRNIHDPADEEDGNLIRFGEFDENRFRDAKNCLLRGALPEESKSLSQSGGMLSNVTEHVKQLWDRMVTR